MSRKICVSGLPRATTANSLTNYFSHYGDVAAAIVKTDPATGKSLRFGFVKFALASSGKLAIRDAALHVLDGKAVEVAAAPEKSASTEWQEEQTVEHEQLAVECEEEGTAVTVAAKRNKIGKVVDERGGRAAANGSKLPQAKAGGGKGVAKTIQKAGSAKTRKSGAAKAKKIFVGGLGKTTTRKHITEYFSHYGELIDVDAKVDKTTGNSRGWATLQYADPASAELVLAEPAGHSVGGQAVTVRVFDKRSGKDKIFVGSLPKSTTTDMVTEYFQYYGALRVVKLKCFEDSGLCQGFGFVEFEDPASAQLALSEKAEHVVNGKKVDVRAYQKNRPPSKLFVGGLSRKTTEKSLTEYFSYYGELNEVRVKLDAETGQCKGFAFIQFSDPVSAELAVSEPEHIIDKKVAAVNVLEKTKPIKLFIGGLAKKTTDASLLEYLSYYGVVKDAVVKKGEGGRSRGFGFARFADPASAEVALAEAEHILDGQRIKLQACRKSSEDCKLFVGGLSKETTNATLSDYMSYFGELVEVEVKINSSTGESRGFAFVEFVDPLSCELAVGEPEHIVDGEAIKVRMSQKGKANEDSKIFVGNLETSTTTEVLREYFSYYGDLTEVEVKTHADSGRSRGFGFATFVDPVSVELVLAETEEHIIEGKAVKIDKASRGKKEARGGVKLFIGGLPQTTTTDTLYEYLAYFGELKDVHVKMDTDTGNCRGFGFARFVDPASAELVLAEAEHSIDNKLVNIRVAEDKPKGKGKGKVTSDVPEEEDDEWDEPGDEAA